MRSSRLLSAFLALALSSVAAPAVDPTVANRNVLLVTQGKAVPALPTRTEELSTFESCPTVALQPSGTRRSTWPMRQCAGSRAGKRVSSGSHSSGSSIGKTFNVNKIYGRKCKDKR